MSHDGDQRRIHSLSTLWEFLLVENFSSPKSVLLLLLVVVVLSVLVSREGKYLKFNFYSAPVPFMSGSSFPIPGPIEMSL